MLNYQLEQKDAETHVTRGHSVKHTEGGSGVVTSDSNPAVGFITCSLSRVLSFQDKRKHSSARYERKHRGRGAIVQMPGPFECLDFSGLLN